MKKTLLLRENPWQFLSRSSQVEPNTIPSQASDPIAISLPPTPPAHFLVGQFQIERLQCACTGPTPPKPRHRKKMARTPVTLKKLEH